MVLDSESILLSTDMFMVEQSFSSIHSGSDLELLSITKWLLMESMADLIDVPSLVQTIMASVIDNMSVPVVVSSMNIKAVATVVADVLSLACIPSDSGVVCTVPWSDCNSNILSEALSLLVCDGIASSSPGSDRLSSGIKGKPLILVTWVVVPDSKSILVTTNVFSPEKSFVAFHS